MISYRLKKLLFGSAAAAEAKDLDQGLRQIKAIRQMPGQPLEINELSFDVVHRFAARANQVVMRFEIAIHAQRGRMRSDLSQHPTLDEKPEIVVDRGQRNRWNAAPDRGVNIFGRIVSVGGDNRLIYYLTLVRDRQAALRGQLTKLLMGEAHDYRMIIIIKRSRTVSTEIFPLMWNLRPRRGWSAAKSRLCSKITTLDTQAAGAKGWLPDKLNYTNSLSG